MWLFLTVPWVGLQCLIVVCPDRTNLLFNLHCCGLDENIVNLQIFCACLIQSHLVTKSVSIISINGPQTLDIYRNCVQSEERTFHKSFHLSNSSPSSVLLHIIFTLNPYEPSFLFLENPWNTYIAILQTRSKQEVILTFKLVKSIKMDRRLKRTICFDKCPSCWLSPRPQLITLSKMTPITVIMTCNQRSKSLITRR